MANLKAGTLIGGNLIWDAGNLPLRTTNNDLYIRTARVYTTEFKPTYADVGAVNKAGDTMTGNLAITHGNDASIWINGGTNKDTQLYFTEDGKNHGAYIRYAGAESENKTYFGTRQNGVEKHFMEIPRFGGVNFPITPTASSAPTASGHLTRKDYVDQQVATKVALGGSTMTGKLTLNYTSSVRVPVGNSSQRGDSARGDFRFNTDEISFEGHDGNEWQPIGSGRVAYTMYTSNFTASRGKGHLVDTRNAGIVVTLPSGVRNSDFVVIGDGSKNASKNPFWVAGFNGDRLLVDRDNCVLRFGYFGNKWIIEDGVGEAGAIDKGEYVARAGSTMTGDLNITNKKVSISNATGPSAQFEALDGSNIKGIFRTSAGDTILGTMVANAWQGYIKVGPNSGFTYTPAGAEYKVYHQGFKPNAADVSATRADAYVGEGMRQLGGLESKVGDDYLYRYYKICELTDSRSMDTTFDIIVSADKNYAGSTGRYYVNVSRYSGSGDVQGSFHVAINRKHGGPDMIEVAVKKEEGKTTLWARAKRMWGNMAVQVINRSEDGSKPSWVADGTFVLSNDPILNGTVKMNCGNIYSGDDNAIIYTLNEYFNRVHDSGARVYSPVNKPTATDIGAAAIVSNKIVVPSHSGSLGATIKNQNSSGYESWLTSRPDNDSAHKGIGIHETLGPVYWDGKTKQTIYHTSNKPSPADLGAVSLTADNGMTGILRIKNTAHNTIPATDECKYDGFGVIGNRGTVYLTNSSTSSNAQVQIGVGGKHADAPKLTVYANKVESTVDLLERGKRVYSENNKPSAADVGALALTGGTVSSIVDNSTNIGKSVCTYDKITSWAHTVGSSKFVQPSSTGNPNGQGGYWQTIGRRDSAGGYAGIWVDYQNSRNDVYIGKNETGTNAPIWAKVYTDKNKPTADDVGAWPTSRVNQAGNNWADVVNKVPMISPVGVMEVGSHIDMKCQDTNVDFNWRLHANDPSAFVVRNGAGAEALTVRGTGEIVTPAGGFSAGGSTCGFFAYTKVRGGEAAAIVRGSSEEYPWSSWRTSPAGLLIDAPNAHTGAHSIFKATRWGAHHLAAMDVHYGGGDINQVQLSMHLGPSNNQFAFQAAGGGFSQNGWHTGSDSRFKENIKPISSVRTSWLDKVCSLNASSFKYKISDKQSIGFIAQDVHKVIPEAISVQIDTTIPEAEREGTDRLFIDPMAIIAAQNEAIKELRARLEALENK